eukprot:superscaffoldBa00000347_g3986
MACFFRRRIAAKLGRTLQQSEEAFIPALSAAPVFKKQLSVFVQTADFKLSLSTLRVSGILPSSGDIQLQTEDLATRLKQDSVVEDISAGRGVINFRVNRTLLAQKILEPFGNGEDDKFGLNSELFNNLKRGTTLVEYSSPNIAKKFHAGHLRSTIIGNFIANLKQTLGNNVIRMNYLGDWGMQFGLLGAGFSQFGSQEKLKQNPLQHLFEVYVQVNKEAEHNEDMRLAARDFFRQLEQHESQAVSLWQQFREITVDEYQHVYKTDKSQANHFHQLFQILLALGHSWADRCQHVPFGLVQGMKTRSGEVVFLEDVLDEARARMLHNMSQSKTTKEMDNPEDTAEKVGISALIVQDFKGPLQSDYKFDWDRMLQAQGDTGVFLQYTHARLCSYDEVLYQSAQDLQPKHLVNFLLKLW